jgi:hypothetical protein
MKPHSLSPVPDYGMQSNRTPRAFPVKRATNFFSNWLFDRFLSLVKFDRKRKLSECQHKEAVMSVTSTLSFPSALQGRIM